MNFTLNVCGAPLSSQSADSAYRFASAALASGHQIDRIFFYGDGVLCANSLQSPPSDELNLFSKWSELANKYQLSLIVCIAAAVRRGILNQDEAKRYNKAQYNLTAPFEVSGLGQLIESVVNSDRTLTFTD